MTAQKKCSKCSIIKPSSEFYKNKKSKDGLRSNCIRCGIEYKNLHIEKIKVQTKNYNEKRKEQKKKWANDNKIKVENSRKKWISNNRETRLEYLKDYNKKYYEENRITRLEYSKQKQKEYRKNNPVFRIKQNLRRRINRFIKNKSQSTEKILGITYDDFLKYLISKFTEGMTIEKIGNEIHIDHIIPLSSAKSEEEIIKLSHYTNLQPLWKKDNLKKSNKVDYLYE